jgi:hypothetical protein
MASECGVMVAGQGSGKPFVVSGCASKSCGPGEAPLDDPAAGQQNEAAFGFCRFDHEQLNACDAGAF